MTHLDMDGLKAVFSRLDTIMTDHRETLTELDGVMGDGELGITMHKAFKAAHAEASGFGGKDQGKLFAQVGMSIARAAPSTMGTLLARGFMKGGSAVMQREELSLADLSAFFRAFTNAIMEAGKTRPGNKTIVDSLDHASRALEKAVDEQKLLDEGLESAYDAAKEGVEETKNMRAQHGRAAYYRDRSIGVVDAGAMVGLLLVQGFMEGNK
jgi:dihydroxyacetone kinase-like protein